MSNNNLKKIKIEENNNSLYIPNSNTSFLFSNFSLLINNKTNDILFNGNPEFLTPAVKKLLASSKYFSCGYLFSICVCKNGVFSWGRNGNGQLGIDNQNYQTSPQQIEFFKNPEEILSISCGLDFCICVCKTGVFSWGRNFWGQLGIGNEDYKSSIQKIEFFKNPEEILSLSCGAGFSVCVCKSGVFSWGQNIVGQLGIGKNIEYEYNIGKIQFFKDPEEIISLCCGMDFCVCICINGIFSWGRNKYGQLGIGDFCDQYSPKQINFVLLNNPKEIISISCGDEFCICLCNNGLFSWGKNDEGQLGVGNFTTQSFPQQIKYFSNPESIIYFSCGSRFCICICENGIIGWGDNSHGQLGIGHSKYTYPQPIELKENIYSFSDLSFPKSYTHPTKHIKILLLILAREYLDPETHLLGRYYLPLDMFKLLLKLI